MFIFFYGYSFLYFLSCIMGYHVNLVITLLICVIGYLISRSFLRTRKIIFYTAMVLIIGTLIAAVVLYYSNQLLVVLNAIQTYIEPFYQSLYIESVKIDILRQALVELLIITLVYKFVFVLKEKKYTMTVYTIISLILCVSSFLLGRLFNPKDMTGFMVFAGGLIIYFFYNYFMLNKHKINGNESYMPFIVLGSVFFVVVIGLSYLWYLKAPHPFERKVSYTNVAGLNNQPLKEYEKIIYDVDTSGKISSQVDFKNIELFKIKATSTRYYKAVVFEDYNNSTWSQNNDMQYYSPLGDFIEYGDPEIIKLDYTHINTDILFASTNGIYEFIQFGENMTIVMDSRRGTYKFNANLNDEAEFKGSFMIGYLAYNERIRDQDWANELSLRNNEKQISLDSGYSFPDGYEDIEALALEVTQGLNTDFDKVNAVLTYLKNNYTYNTKPPQPQPNEDIIRHFLFESKVGFCQQFASAAALMIRSLNIPTRYVVGFYIDPVIPFEDFSSEAYMSRNNDGFKSVLDANAHAWLEVYFPTNGWVNFEATPGFVFSALEVEEEVVETVVDVDTQEQSEKDQANKRLTLVIMIGLLVLIIVGGCVFLMARLVLKKRRLMHNANAYKLQRIYSIILDYLKVVKLEKLHYETPREYANRIDTSSFIGSNLGFNKILIGSNLGFNKIISIYENMAYGDQEINLDELNTYKLFLKAIKREVKQHGGKLKFFKTSIKEFFIY